MHWTFPRSQCGSYLASFKGMNNGMEHDFDAADFLQGGASS